MKTSKKIEIDESKLPYHPERISEWKEKGDCFPIYVEIGPTNFCNHHCVFCALDFLNKKEINYIDREVMLRNLENMAECGVKSIMFAGEGESLAHRDTPLFVRKAKESGIDVSITTNGILFGEKKQEECLPYLSWIRFSIDAGNSETYSQIHRTNPRDFSRLIKNIENFVKLRNNQKLEISIGAQFLILPSNIDEPIKLAKILREIGVDNLQIKPYSHHPNSLNDFYTESERYDKLEEELKQFNSEDFQIKFRRTTIERISEGATYPICYGLPFFTLIDSKGNVLPCNLFYNNEEFTYGNLYKNSFSEIWKSDKRTEVLRKLEHRGVSECRRGCRLDASNRYLQRLKNPLPYDNFI